MISAHGTRKSLRESLRGLDISLKQDANGLLNYCVHTGLGVFINLIETDVVLAVASIAELRHSCERDLRRASTSKKVKRSCGCSVYFDGQLKDECRQTGYQGDTLVDILVNGPYLTASIRRWPNYDKIAFHRPSTSELTTRRPQRAQIG